MKPTSRYIVTSYNLYCKVWPWPFLASVNLFSASAPSCPTSPERSARRVLRWRLRVATVRAKQPEIRWTKKASWLLQKSGIITVHLQHTFIFQFYGVNISELPSCKLSFLVVLILFFQQYWIVVHRNVDTWWTFCFFEILFTKKYCTQYE